MSHAGEAEWRAAALAGDPLAWRCLYDSARVKLAAYVRWRCGSQPEVAEECLQQTWLTAVAQLRRFDPARGDFLSWLRGIGGNVVRTHSRRRQPGPLDHDPPAAERPEDGSRVMAALAALPAHYEAILRQKYLDGASVASIAAANGVSEKTVESLLTRARAAFRAAYLRDAEP